MCVKGPLALALPEPRVELKVYYKLSAESQSLFTQNTAASSKMSIWRTPGSAKDGGLRFAPEAISGGASSSPSLLRLQPVPARLIYCERLARRLDVLNDVHATVCNSQRLEGIIEREALVLVQVTAIIDDHVKLRCTAEDPIKIVFTPLVSGVHRGPLCTQLWMSPDPVLHAFTIVFHVVVLRRGERCQQLVPSRDAAASRLGAALAISATAKSDLEHPKWFAVHALAQHHGC
eukprot:scaffold75525_cov69-Phaeocystis_antarctica.AAC.1